MELRSFFTKQRYIILGAGIVMFVICITLANILGHDSEFGVLFIDLSGSAITIMATALVIEYLQTIEENNRTKQIADMAEGEIQAICYRITLAIVKLHGFQEKKSDQQNLDSLKAVEAYIEKSKVLIHSHKDTENNINPEYIGEYKNALHAHEQEVDQALTLYGYALPYSLRTRLLDLRANIQIMVRVMNFINETDSINKNHQALLKDACTVLYKSTKDVLQHGSRTAKNKQIASKPNRVSQ